MTESDYRLTRLPLQHGAGQIPALGFGTLIAPSDIGTKAKSARYSKRRWPREP
jgi:hypothetical protein